MSDVVDGSREEKRQHAQIVTVRRDSVSLGQVLFYARGEEPGLGGGLFPEAEAGGRASERERVRNQANERREGRRDGSRTGFLG